MHIGTCVYDLHVCVCVIVVAALGRVCSAPGCAAGTKDLSVLPGGI